jgi:hypothetical protein
MITRDQQPRLASLAIVAFSVASALAGDQPYLNLARQLAGRYEGVAGPGNNLRIVVQPGRPNPEEQHLTVTVLGKYNGSNVRFDGLLALQPQGETVRLIWVSRRSDCQVDIHPAGDGFEGVTLPGTCQTAFQNPTPGKWQFQTEPGSFRIRNVETGETLRFRKTKSLGK